MSEPVETPLESLEYRTEVKQLLDILAHSLYTDREIFLRELISNASDALNRIQFEMLTNHEVVDPDAELAIHIEVDDEAKVITLRDSGIGMNRDEMVENLGTIAHSGARTFLEKAGEGKSTQEEIIGQFGVGFYSVFMVAEDVVVTSRSYRPQDDAAQWESKGDSRFSLAAAEKRDRGTEIRIKLKEDAAEFASTWRMESIVKKHSDYVSFPIYVKGTEGEAKVANRRTALWRQSPSKV
ncbi:MAG: ATP-binding protein, partial [Caldilinea sp.]|nr:ATP-binding protein [Caldilinea sp.]